MTIFLRFPDETAAQSALAGYFDTDYGWRTASLGHALDPIGTLYDPGTYDDEGNEITPPIALEGWHVNFIGELPEAALPYALTPANPRVVFAS
jgi:hypothetical protein